MTDCQTEKYQKNQMTRDKIIEKLRENHCRITKQRLLILDIILKNQCSCCKEIYAEASAQDPGIGTATVYRMVNRLEEIGAISRKNMYKVVNPDVESGKHACTVVLDDDTTYSLSPQRWRDIVRAGLASCGYLKKQKVVSVVVSQREV